MSRRPRAVAPAGAPSVPAASTFTLTAQQFTGPLPSPEVLAEYDNILPGFAERLLVQFERQSDHRMELERSVIAADIRSRYVGQVFALVIALAFLAGACFFAYKGHPVEGAALAGVSLAGLVSVFVSGRALQAKERVEKEKVKRGQIPS